MIRALDRWLPSYLLRDRRRPPASPGQPLHVFIAVCDHFEPFHHTDKTGALKALADWQSLWPGLVNTHRDSSGRGPRHSFFYPVEQYDPDVIARLASLCQRTGSEVEVHLHHAGDTDVSLAAKLQLGLRQLASHGLLSRLPDGSPRYGFIHGDWALDNSHPRRLHCGVDNELAVLKAAGCYADFTLPSAPSPAQIPTVNSLYYAREDGLPASHSRGTPVRASATAPLASSPDHLLLVQGPLGLNWSRRKFGLLPRLENADLTAANPPTLARFHLWTRLSPFVQDGPPWVFVKLHTHGGIPRNYHALLGDPASRFHSDLARAARQNPALRYHYVTARELVNLIHAAEAGHSGDPSLWLDFHLPPPPLLAQTPGESSR
jgi:hypothetical protein